ncbi:MAG: dTDP-4-dehydrorhamnose reductase [Prevotellaceae bacterium]|nr:dTDP-4-dehydrorhamnose reductase [Prevotellaceae bacterium]MEE1241195.1 dTDP-4-dehydrorhamnose reductase [Bacteroidaceae bacterium]
MNILVTGANGQLGREMRLTAKESSHHYIFTDVAPAEGLETILLDITDRNAVEQMVSEEQVGAIVNCAAWTDVDACETDSVMAAKAERINALAPAILAQAMRDVNGLLVHISTDYVFGLEPYNTPCNEEQKGTPTGVYGHSKLRGEMVIRNSGVQYLILRTSWLYSEYGRNFCRTMMKLTAEKPQVNVVFDQTGTPTYALDLAQAITTILERESWRGNTGIYNYSNEGVCSWYDFAMTIRKMAGHEACQINPCHSSEYPSPVKRPAYSVLDKSKFKQTFHLSIPYWVESLLKCVNNLKGNI